jgi:hypothetical protein
MFGLVAVSSLVFGTGCGGDTCEDIADALNGLDKKVKDCPSLGTSEVEFSDADVAECKEDLKKCSASDKDKLDDTVDCINDLPNCKSGEDSAWAAKFQACLVKGSTVTCLDGN